MYDLLLPLVLRAGIYFVVLGCTLGFLLGLGVSSEPGVIFVVLEHFGGVSYCNSFAMYIMALVVLFPYVRLRKLFFGD